MKGHTEGFSPAAVSSIFFTLCNDASEGVRLPVSSLLFAIDSDAHPEIAEGFEKFLPAYIGPDEDSVSAEQFVEMHDDMYASSPDNFYALLSTVWRI